MIEASNFLPEWASPPGATVSDILEDREKSAEEFAIEIGYTSRDLKKLLDGTLPITEEIADRLSQALGATADFWLSREAHYRESLKRLTASEQWLKGIPVKQMIEFGWIDKANGITAKKHACLKFFDVPTVAEWHAKHKWINKQTAFRTSATFSSAEGAVLAWLRKGEIDAASINCANWDRARLHAALPEIRKLTRKKNPSQFLDTLKNICSECGVAVVIAKAPSGCRASGATRFLTPNKALIMLSFRYLSDDHLWFTFFHEAGHLILHNSSSLFLEGDNLCSGNEEDEANEFASNILVPPTSRESMLALRADAKAVMRFARAIGVSPGIIVGQLQHAGIFRKNQLNNLKARYTWG